MDFPRPFRLLLVGVVLNRVATFIFPFLTLALRERGLSPEETGLVFLAFGAGSVAALVFGGLLTDAFGRRRLMLVSLFGGGSIAVALGTVESPAAFVALLLLYGFVSDLFRPAVYATVADVLPSARRHEGIAALRTAVNLGLAIGVSLGGLLWHLGPGVLFPADGATTILFGAIVWLGIPETRKAAASGEAPRPAALWRALARDHILRTALLCTVAWSLFMVSFMTVLPLTVEEWAGYPASVYGFTFGLNCLLVALFQMHATRSSGGSRRLRVAAAGMLLGGLAVAAVPAVRHWAWFLGVMAAYTCGEMLVIPGVTAFLSDWAPPSLRGTYLGIHQSAFSLAILAGPPLMLPLRDRVGEAAYWPLFLILALPAAWALLRMDRTADRPELLRGTD